jgi:hypothetical protein
MLTAAAAGLIVGVGTGQGLQVEWPVRPTPAPVRIVATPVPTANDAIADDADAALLGDIEFALAERGVDELQPLDALTPRVTLVASR